MSLLWTVAACLLVAVLAAPRSGDAAGGRGKFSMEGNMECTWRARDVADSVKLAVKCESPEARVKGGVTDLTCNYEATPQTCPGYLSDPRGFWKQVGRAFKRLRGKVCKDERALVKAGMCKRAPRDAHFKLDPSSSVSSAQSGQQKLPSRLLPRPTTTAAAVGATACTRRADHRRTAEENCGSTWASLCTFFLSIAQTGDDCP